MKKWLGFFLLGIVAACAGDDGVEAPPEEATPVVDVRTEHLICPQVAVIREAEEAADFGGKKASQENLVAKVRLRRLIGDCAYRKETDDPDEPTGIDLSFILDAAAMKGDAFNGTKAFFPYFVAIVDPAENVVRREQFDLSFSFSGNNRLVEKEERLHVFIPLPPESLLQGPTYRVLIGLLKPPSPGADQMSKSSDDK
ncbi:MAG: hypothetical protein PHS57_07730 [Alphaproteobacteria bacterium]|nr:hypothetical protein [Alphaproteobacteria bacterium]